MIIQKKNGESKSIRYDGPADGFEAVRETANKAIDNDS